MNQSVKNIVKVFGVLMLMVVTGIGVSRCYYDSQEELYISLTDQCDTTNITYESSVKPIMQENCLGCHGSSYASDGDGLDLRTYNQVKTNIDNILGSINHSSGHKYMPKNAPPLKQCKIDIIQMWKDAEFPQN
jgi:hypothetical protein